MYLNPNGYSVSISFVVDEEMDPDKILGIIKREIPSASKVDASVREIIDEPIESLDLGVRTYNPLKRAQINTIGDLLEFSYKDLLELKHFGVKASWELAEKLMENFGMALPESKS
jgi:DNA-directed RNA polymerase alpha subunit